MDETERERLIRCLRMKDERIAETEEKLNRLIKINENLREQLEIAEQRLYSSMDKSI